MFFSLLAVERSSSNSRPAIGSSTSAFNVAVDYPLNYLTLPLGYKGLGGRDFLAHFAISLDFAILD